MALRDDVVAKIKERLVQIFDVDPNALSEDTSFVALGAKSGNVSQMTTFLEDEFDVEIPFMKFIRQSTVGQAADFVVDLVENY
jgi:acyl carrier protein